MGIDLELTKSTLVTLIEKLRDSQEEYRDAAERVEAEDLKLALMDFSTLRAWFLGKLQNEILRLGAQDPPKAGSLGGSLHRAWMSLKTAVASDHDLAIIEHCERDEEKLIRSYGEALDRELPRYIRELLEGQLEQIGKMRKHLTELKQRSAVV